jgi:16S rRNA (cytidine1402-2'-O)-methyltransferase
VIVLYESPHRIEKTVQTINDEWGEDVQLSISREISKKFEQHLRGKVGEVLEKIKSHPLKGEIVLVLDRRL